MEQLTLEFGPASPWCQRWDRRIHSWRHTSAGGFDPNRYEVHEIDRATAKDYILKHHYSGCYPSDALRYGLFLVTENQDTGLDLVGVAVLSTPMQASVLTNVFPELVPYKAGQPGATELGRLVLADAVEGNGESWFIGQVFNEAAAHGVQGVVSFSDPTPRTINGCIVFPGHIGTIYQATNAVYTGRATPRTLTVLADGSVLNDRAKQKVRRQERGHDHVERLLVSLGAHPRRLNQPPAKWLSEAIGEVDHVALRHRGNHRYAFRLGITRRQRQQVTIAIPAAPYPKERDAA